MFDSVRLDSWLVILPDDFDPGKSNYPGLSLEQLYISDVAAAIYIKITSEQYNNEPKIMRSRLKGLLDTVNTCLEQTGLTLPLFGVVQSPSTFVEHIGTWAADQDWHRGDFTLLSVRDKTDALGLICDLLSAASDSWATLPVMQPIPIDKYIDAVRDEKRMQKLSSERDHLVETILADWKDGIAAEDGITQWVELQLEEARKLLKEDSDD